jgi:hypothetical protein
VLPFTPCLSKALWNIRAQIPQTITLHHKLYFHTFLKHFPEALDVPICSGGKIMSHKSFTPGLWIRDKLYPLSNRSRYYWHRLPRVPILGPAFSRLGLIPQMKTERNEILDAVLQLIPLDHPDINPDRVRALQKAQPPYDWPERLGRRMLFYWQVWRLVMEGRLTTHNADTFLEQEPS